ncbi:MAG: mechanosensitive ion channel family protein [Actinomycetota bacterium]|nr:mechanosensitive ion channel family protein [Actinomycetota bacterium]
MDEHGYMYDLLRKVGLTDFQASTGEFLLVRPLKLALLVVAGLVLARIGSRATRRFVRTLHARSLLRTTSARAQQRATTIGDVLANLVLAVVWTIVALLVLGEVGVDLAPLLAGAGIVGIALGFGAQSLVKDFLSGLFIILEDQYGVGDVIVLKDATGTVEDVSLRVTRFRATDGTVWFIPNGEIRGVGNASMEWSRAMIDVLVSYDNDVSAVGRYVTEVTREFAEDPAWDDVVLEPPEVWGVQAMSADGLTVRVVVKTAPGEQYAVGRDLRGRISERLRREGVRGPGQSVLVSGGTLDAGTPPPPPEDGER